MIENEDVSTNEDLGKITEYALCLLLETPFHGQYRYSVDKAYRIANRLAPLQSKLDGFVHTGNVSKEFDFQRGSSEGLSVKTIKTGSWKVCPQVIGQTTKHRFSQYFNIGNESPEMIKSFIERNILTLLREYERHTFHCDVLFFHERLDYVSLISRADSFQWDNYSYALSRLASTYDWNESSTLRIFGSENPSPKTLGEFQVHQNRDNVKFRFDLKTLLEVFIDKLDVQEI